MNEPKINYSKINVLLFNSHDIYNHISNILDKFDVQLVFRLDEQITFVYLICLHKIKTLMCLL